MKTHKDRLKEAVDIFLDFYSKYPHSKKQAIKKGENMFIMSLEVTLERSFETDNYRKRDFASLKVQGVGRNFKENKFSPGCISQCVADYYKEDKIWRCIYTGEKLTEEDLINDFEEVKKLCN